MSVHDNEAEVKRLLGIPEDEPIFILRGQDKLALGALDHYEESAFEARVRQGMESTSEWKTNMADVVTIFEEFDTKFPDRMKFPD